MKTKMRMRIVSVLLAAALLFAVAPAASATDTQGVRCDKTAQVNADGTVTISLRAFQTGNVPAADVVMILDVSGSMENSTPVPVDEIDSTRDYYVRYVRAIEVDGEQKFKRVNVRVHNTAAAGEEPTWFGLFEEDMPEMQVVPGDGTEGTFRFYTGAMDALRAAATSFVHSIAQNAAQYDADHRIAVVEFSSPVPKGTDALCTHTTQPDPYYASILTGDGTASGALLSAKDSEAELSDVFAAMTAAGPTYSDDAMTQAKRILSASTADRRVAILFTDGGPGSYGWEYDTDASSIPTANGAIAAAAEMKKSGVQIYTIGVFNDENRLGETGEKNSKYLELVSSDYPDAESLTVTGTKQADGYCSIGDLHMDLSGAFAGISSVLGEPVDSAQVRDTVSKYFYLTDAQRQALLQAYAGAQIIDNEDGSTTISLDAVDFPPVAIHANGEIVDENDPGVFQMTFDVTPRGEFLGGPGVSTNSGLCGVFVDGVQIAQFAPPTVDVPVNESAIGDLLVVTPQTLYRNEKLTTDMLYRDLSASPAADYADISYTVTDPDGEAFASRDMTQAGTFLFTVTMQAQIGDRTFTQRKTVDVVVREDAVESLQITAVPTKTRYYLGERVQLDGVEALATMQSGKTLTLTAQDLSVSGEPLTELGERTVYVTFGGVQATFQITVLPFAPTLTIVDTPVKTSYYVGQSPDLAGLTLTYTDEYGAAHTVTEGFSFAPVKFSAAGKQTVTVTYGGASVSFDVTVTAVKAVSATVVSKPTNDRFQYRRSPDFTGLSVRVVYNDGHEEIVRDLSQMDVRPDSDARVRRGAQTYRVTTRGVSATFEMRVRLVWWQWLVLICLFGWIWY